MLKKLFAKLGIFYGWFMVLTGIIIMGVAYGTVFNCFSLFTIPVSEGMGYSRQSFATNLTIIFICFTLISIFSGKIFSVFKLHGVMCVCAVLLPIAYFCNSLCTKLWQFYLLSVVQGICIPILSFTAFSIIIANWFEDRRGLAMGFTFMGSGLGGFILNLLASKWLADRGFAFTYRTLGIIMAVVLIPMVFFVLKIRPEDIGLKALGAKDKEDGAPVELYGPTLKEAMGGLNFWLLVMTGILIGFTTSTLAQTITPHITDCGFDPVYAARINAGYFAFLCFCKVTMGFAYDKLGMKPTTIIAMLMVALGLVALYFGTFQIAHVFVILGSGGCAAGSVALPMLTQAGCGNRDFSTINGIVTASNTLGGAMCPFITNAIYDGSGSYNFALLMAVALIAVTILLVLITKVLKKDAAAD